MKHISVNIREVQILIPRLLIERKINLVRAKLVFLILLMAVISSLISWLFYSSNGYHLAYNDAMSHLAITRRVIDNITPGVAQLGSVWLPLIHVLMLPTIWIDWFWRTGFSGAMISMTAFIVTVIYTYKTTYLVTKNRIASIVGAFIVLTNINFLYLQTTALTEPLFIALLSLSIYFFASWSLSKQPLSIISSALFVSLATLARYDGWAVLLVATAALFYSTWTETKRYTNAEGITILFATLGGFGVFLWLLWNQLIFSDPLYFAFGEFSAKAQQVVLATVKDLPTNGNLPISISVYELAMIFNLGFFTVLFGILGWITFMIKSTNVHLRALGIISISPLVFNIVSLYLGHSILHIPGLYGNTWFNIRYGLIMLPWAALFTGYLMTQTNVLTKVLIPLILVIQTILFYSSGYVVTLEDGIWGSSRKNIKETGKWIERNLSETDGRILASVSSHDAILFASGLPMKRFIHEGTGKLWTDTLKYPDRHARYIIMRTHDQSDFVTKMMDQVPNFNENYELIYDDEFADVYMLKQDET